MMATFLRFYSCLGKCWTMRAAELQKFPLKRSESLFRAC